MKQQYLKGVSTLELNGEKCNGCGMCVAVCPHEVFDIREKRAHIERKDRCMECGACVMNCPAGAISVHAEVGCAVAIIRGWLTGSEPNCDCSDDCC